MFFSVKKVNGNYYLYKLKSYRDKKGYPTNSGEYIGPVDKVEKAIRRWRRKNEN